LAKTGKKKRESSFHNTRKILGAAASPFYIAENGVCASIRSDPNQEIAKTKKIHVKICSRVVLNLDAPGAQDENSN
jgi:azurin